MIHPVTNESATLHGATPAYPADAPADAAARALLERPISLAAHQRDAATARAAASGTITYLRSSR
ncbi:MAG: hypothetical protein RJA99_3980 [Pseudomonadota bacterium]